MAFAVTWAARLADCECDEAAIQAHALAPSKEALDGPLGRGGLPRDWGLLPGAPAPTGTGLTPAGLIQLSRRNTGIN